ncbi:MAG: glycoside hydrolase family 16 protein [Alphaproteobacteria bacterium]|nr:glycoside hydrolase family 16 protein [Alphaproteobacteria bacterium]
MFDDPEWIEVFVDDFDGESLDRDRWTTCYWWDKEGCTNGTTGELNWYQDDNVSIADGTLRLEARRREILASDGRRYDYTSGIVTTGRNSWRIERPLRFSFRYGYVEVRAKVPAGQGLWPAIWLLPTDHDIRPEIDVMEILGHRPDRIEMNYHYTSGSAQNEGLNWDGPDFSADWHRFAVEWRPDAIIWYVDDKERWRFTKRALIADEPMYLLLNLAVGGDWPGPPDNETVFPALFEIDYVRILQPKALVDKST